MERRTRDQCWKCRVLWFGFSERAETGPSVAEGRRRSYGMFRVKPLQSYNWEGRENWEVVVSPAGPARTSKAGRVHGLREPSEEVAASRDPFCVFKERGRKEGETVACSVHACVVLPGAKR